MIKFFRRIRQRLLTENKLSRYLIYAIGEIVLVVIGILIALQVSNWNQKRLETIKLETYFQKLLVEVDEQISITSADVKSREELAVKMRRTLEIIDSGSKENIPELKQSIGSLATAWVHDYSMPFFDEFQDQDLLSKVINKDLKKLLVDLRRYLKNLDSLDDHIENQYFLSIEPFFAKTMNYSEVALPQYKDGLIQGGPATDFATVMGSLEFWNIATLKLELTNSNIYELGIFLDKLQDVRSALAKELESF